MSCFIFRIRSFPCQLQQLACNFLYFQGTCWLFSRGWLNCRNKAVFRGNNRGLLKLFIGCPYNFMLMARNPKSSRVFSTTEEGETSSNLDKQAQLRLSSPLWITLTFANKNLLRHREYRRKPGNKCMDDDTIWPFNFPVSERSCVVEMKAS